MAALSGLRERRRRLGRSLLRRPVRDEPSWFVHHVDHFVVLVPPALQVGPPRTGRPEEARRAYRPRLTPRTLLVPAELHHPWPSAATLLQAAAVRDPAACIRSCTNREGVPGHSG